MARSGGKTVAVGYDGRLASPPLSAALINGLMTSGMEVLKVGRGLSSTTTFAGGAAGEVLPKLLTAVAGKTCIGVAFAIIQCGPFRATGNFQCSLRVLIIELIASMSFSDHSGKRFNGDWWIVGDHQEGEYVSLPLQEDIIVAFRHLVRRKELVGTVPVAPTARIRKTV